MTLAPNVLPPTLDERFDVFGLAIVEYALTAADLVQLDQMFSDLGSSRAGARSAEFAATDLAWLARHETLSALASRLAGQPMRLTRTLAFDESPTANWFVPWHQDRSDEAGERDPLMLAAMVVLRIHLDDCEEDAGPLEVVPGTHRAGRLDRTAITALGGSTAPLLCLAVRGDIVAMRPLLIHRSQRALKPARRRVIHLEYQPATSPH